MHVLEFFFEFLATFIFETLFGLPSFTHGMEKMRRRRRIVGMLISAFFLVVVIATIAILNAYKVL